MLPVSLNVSAMMAYTRTRSSTDSAEARPQLKFVMLVSMRFESIMLSGPPRRAGAM